MSFLKNWGLTTMSFGKVIRIPLWQCSESTSKTDVKTGLWTYGNPMGGINLFGISFPATAVGPWIFFLCRGQKHSASSWREVERCPEKVDLCVCVQQSLCAMSNKNTSTYLAKQEKQGLTIYWWRLCKLLFCGWHQMARYQKTIINCFITDSIHKLIQNCILPKGELPYFNQTSMFSPVRSLNYESRALSFVVNG